MRTDRDGAWKEFIEKFLPSILALTFPRIAELIDWSQSIEFLDKELQEILRDSITGRRYVDKLIRVGLKGGKKMKILLHLEVQHRKDRKLAKRIYGYHRRLAEKHGDDVVTLVILADQDDSWRPSKFEHKLLGCNLLFEFPICKLKDLTADLETLLASPIPAALVIVADWISQTQQKPKERLAWKLRVMENLYEKGLNKREVLGIFALADWLVPLQPPEKEIFRRELLNLETKKNMPYVNSIVEMSVKEERVRSRRERREGLKQGLEKGLEKGMEKGRKEGSIQTMQAVIIDLLRTRFGVRDISVETAIEQKQALPELNALLKLVVLAADFESFKRQGGL